MCQASLSGCSTIRKDKATKKDIYWEKAAANTTVCGDSSTVKQLHSLVEVLADDPNYVNEILQGEKDVHAQIFILCIN
jgi:hypothetical protein